MIISSKTGTDPPTTLVFPPWGHTASLFLSQKDSISETSSVVLGFNTIALHPENM